MLTCLLVVLDTGQTNPPPACKKLHDLRRNVTHMLKNLHEHVVYHTCADFDVWSEILFQPKRQPSSNSNQNFEEENEPQLKRVTGNTVIINNK